LKESFIKIPLFIKSKLTEMELKLNWLNLNVSTKTYVDINVIISKEI